jgi:hypothetical protein
VWPVCVCVCVGREGLAVLWQPNTTSDPHGTRCATLECAAHGATVATAQTSRVYMVGYTPQLDFQKMVKGGQPQAQRATTALTSTEQGRTDTRVCVGAPERRWNY